MQCRYATIGSSDEVSNNIGCMPVRILDPMLCRGTFVAPGATGQVRKKHSCLPPGWGWTHQISMRDSCGLDPMAASIRQRRCLGCDRLAKRGCAGPSRILRHRFVCPVLMTRRTAKTKTDGRSSTSRFIFEFVGAALSLSFLRSASPPGPSGVPILLTSPQNCSEIPFEDRPQTKARLHKGTRNIRIPLFSLALRIYPKGYEPMRIREW